MTTKPGVYEMPAEEYHAHGALSSSGARRLLPPGCPAKFHYERSNPFEPTADMQFGTVTHAILLGDESDLAVLPYKTWQSGESKAAKEAAELAGKLPVKRADYEAAKAIAGVVRSDARVRKYKLFDDGQAEQSLFWTDPETGELLRARPDYSKLEGRRRPAIVDLKTAEKGEPVEFGRSVEKYGYARQAPWYIDGVHALDLADDPAFIFVIVEKTPPYLVTVAQLDAQSIEAGRFYNRRAIRLFAKCKANNDWPGYDHGADGIATISLPPWAINDYYRES